MTKGIQDFTSLLKRCTVRVISRNGPVGTGFFVAPGRVLTCAHVVGETSASRQRLEIEWQGQRLEGVLEAILPDPCPDSQVFPDVALISTKALATPCALMKKGFSSNAEMYSFGYTNEAQGGESLSCLCEGEKNYDFSAERQMIKLKGSQVLPGISGAPLLNLKTGGVCGIIKRTRDETNDLGGIAVRVELAEDAFPRIVRESHKFHEGNRQWRDSFERYMQEQREEVDREFKRDKKQSETMAENTPSDVMSPSVADWNPDWKPKFVLEGLRQDGEASPSELKTGTRIAVTFALEPSRRWRDPKLSTAAILNDADAAARPLPSGMWAILKKEPVKPGSTDFWKGFPLCIPTFEVPVEWRLESYVYGEPWGSAKKRVVKRFLQEFSGKSIECVVVAVKSSKDHIWDLVVQSADYDALLHMQWAYYKGLESALSRGRYFKSKAILSLSEHALKRFAYEDVATDPSFRNLIPITFRERIRERPIEGEDVYLMLHGLIARERDALTRWEAQHIPKVDPRNLTGTR